MSSKEDGGNVNILQRLSVSRYKAAPFEPYNKYLLPLPKAIKNENETSSIVY